MRIGLERLDLLAKNRPKARKKHKVNPNSEVQKAIEKQKELNKAHREATSNNKHSGNRNACTDEDCASMIAEWLENNVPSVQIKDEKPIPHLEQKGKFNVSEY